METKTKTLPTNWHAQELSKVLKQLKSDPDTGLAPSVVSERLSAWGKNVLPHGKTITWWQMLWRQFQSPLVYILLIAAGLTWWIKEYSDMIVILAVVSVNAIIGLFQEYRANQIFEKLRATVRVTAFLLRDGKLITQDSEELVPGDIVMLKSGNKVPADARIIKESNLEVNEALLTGESKAVSKAEVLAKLDSQLGDRHNMVFMGTVVERGEGLAVVVNTGARTEIGQISLLTQTQNDEQSPLQLRMEKLGKFLSLVFLAISAAIFLIGVMEGDPIIEMIKTTIAVAVAAIPEGLPAAISIILAVASKKILDRKGLVRKLIAAETLGSTSVICTDKTGTLTLGQMRVEELITQNQEQSLLALALANEAVIEEHEGRYQVLGEGTDKAKMEKFLQEGGNLKDTLKNLPRCGLLPFEEVRKYLASFHVAKNQTIIYITGAPEAILAKSQLGSAEQLEIKKTYEQFALRGFRVIGMAMKTLTIKPKQKWSMIEMEEAIAQVTYLGLAAIRDPIRSDVRETIALTKRAGIKVLMVTGDHVLTAKSIGLELGLSTAENAVISGEELDKLSDTELKKRISTLEIIARVNPVHKLRIIKAWQLLGAVVAMTGDGVNDAPSLKSADIGIAIGSGTDVSKEASDLVLLDDSFSTITAAIAEGRTGFANIRKATVVVMSNAFAEITLITSSLIFRTPFPITAIQILWVNLIVDSLPVLAMAFEPSEKTIMETKPNAPTEPILDKESKSLIFVVSIFSDLTLVGIFLYLFKFQGWDLTSVQSLMFVAIATPTLLTVYSLKSFTTPIFRLNLFNNPLLIFSSVLGFAMMLFAIYFPPLNNFLKTTPLHWFPALLAFLIFPSYKLLLVELTKWWFRVHAR